MHDSFLNSTIFGLVFFCKLSKLVFIINSLYNIDVITYISVSVISYHDECDMAPHEFCIDQQSLQSS